MGLVSQPCAKHPGTVAPTSYKPVPTEVDPAKVAKCSTAEVGHEGSMGDTSPEQKQLEEELANLQAQEALLNEMAALKLLEEEQSELQKSSKLEDMRSLLNSSVPAASHSAPFPAGTLSEILFHISWLYISIIFITHIYIYISSCITYASATPRHHLGSSWHFALYDRWVWCASRDPCGCCWPLWGSPLLNFNSVPYNNYCLQHFAPHFAGDFWLWVWGVGLGHLPWKAVCSQGWVVVSRSKPGPSVCHRTPKRCP